MQNGSACRCEIDRNVSTALVIGRSIDRHRLEVLLEAQADDHAEAAGLILIVSWIPDPWSRRGHLSKRVSAFSIPYDFVVLKNLLQ